MKKTASLIYRERWNDPEFIKLFLGFKRLLTTSETDFAHECAEIIVQQLPNSIRVLDLGAGDGMVSLAFLEILSRYRQIASYTAIDISKELVKILVSKKENFERYSKDIHFEWVDALVFTPTTRPNLIVTFNSWFGLPPSEISRYLSFLEPGGMLAIALGSSDSITTDLPIQFVEPVRSSEDIIEWLEHNKVGYIRHKIVSHRLERSDFLNSKGTHPEAETFFRYLLRAPSGAIDHIVPYLRQKPDSYFKTPKDLILVRKQV